LVISVDNLSFGGTGKTTLVTAIGKFLEQKKIGFAIITRGYKSKLEHTGAKVQPHHQTPDVGDEAMLYKSHFHSDTTPQDIYVGKKRKQSINHAIRDGHKIHILDDGFQATNIFKDIKIMLFNPQHHYFYLRNFKWLMKKEDFLYFFRAFPVNKEKFKHSICGIYDFEIQHFYTIDGRILEKDTAQQYKLIGFSALGDNERFKDDLSAFQLQEFFSFSDHHAYSEAEIKMLNTRRIEKKADYLVCTEKDYMKLKGINITDIPLIYAQNSIKLNPNFMDYLWEYAKKHNNLQT
jgi:tetraacyldisaccharide 4'-kinase